MALSKSVLKAQDIIVCQLCELDPKLKWRCMECELLMCKRCYEKIHPKFKNAKDHQIIDIKEVRSYQSAQKDFTRIKCNQHDTTACCLYCSSCGVLVCPICIKKGHKGHNFVEISECYREKLELLEDKLKIDFYKDEIAKQYSETAKQKSHVVEIDERVRKAIQDNLEAWRKAGEKYAERLSEEVTRRSDEINKTLSIRQAKLEQSKDKVMQMQKILLEMQEKQDASFFFENIGTMLQNIEVAIIENPTPVDISMPKFTPANISQDLFGKLGENLEEDMRVKNMKIRVKRELTTELTGCHVLAANSDRLVWISNENTSEVVIYKVMATTVSKLNTLKIKVDNMQHYSNNHILIADGTYTLKILQGEKGKIKEFKCDASQLLIIAVHVTEDNKIIVGAKRNASGNLFKEKQVVIRMDSQGNQEKTWEIDENNKKIFTYPKSLSSTKEGNIFVIDVLTTRYDSRIVVLRNDGGVLNTYSGQEDVSKHGHLFAPTDMKKTPSNNIIICDPNNNVLHLLNNAGNFLRHFDMKTVGVYEPCCIAFSSSETMFIGTDPNSGKGKLYQLEFSETL